MRCKWATSEVLINYHDIEYSKLVTRNEEIFANLCYEIFQAGLSYKIVLQKKAVLKQFFLNFDYKKIAKISDDEILKKLRLKENELMIKNQKKVLAIVHNAKVVNNILKKYRSFYHFLLINFDNTKGQDFLINKYLKIFKKWGFKFIGYITINSFIQAIGVIDGHDETCQLKAKSNDVFIAQLTENFGVEVTLKNNSITKVTLFDLKGLKINSLTSNQQIIIDLLKLLFNNEISSFKYCYLINGSDFQKRVFHQVQQIKYGRTVTYQEIANQIFYFGAARAVGNALKKNQLAIIVPAHRVVSKNGNISQLRIELINYEIKKLGD